MFASDFVAVLALLLSNSVSEGFEDVMHSQ